MLFGDRRAVSTSGLKSTGGFLSTFRNNNNNNNNNAPFLQPPVTAAERERDREREKNKCFPTTDNKATAADPVQAKRGLSEVSFSVDWKDELDCAEDADDELLRSCMHSLGDLGSDGAQTAMVLHFHQTDLATQSIVAEAKIERSVQQVVTFYRSFCSIHSLPCVLTLEDDLAIVTALSRSLSLTLSDLQQLDDARDRLEHKTHALFSSVCTLLGTHFWDDAAVRQFLSEDKQGSDVELFRLQWQVEHWKELIVTAQKRLSILKFRPLSERSVSVAAPAAALAPLDAPPAFPGALQGLRFEDLAFRESSNTERLTDMSFLPSMCSTATANTVSTVGGYTHRGTLFGGQGGAGGGGFVPAHYATRCVSPVVNRCVSPVNRCVSPVKPAPCSAPAAPCAAPVSASVAPAAPISPAVLPSSAQLPLDLVQLLLRDSLYEPAVAEIVSLLTQFPQSLHSAKLSFLQRRLLPAHSPTARLFDVGLQAIHCALCDDEMRVCCVGDAAALASVQDKQRSSKSVSVGERAFPGTVLEQSVCAALAPYASTKKNRETMVRDEVVGDFAVGYNAAAQQSKEKGTLHGSLSGTPFLISFQDHVEAALLLLFDEMNDIVFAAKQRQCGGSASHTHRELFKQSVRLVRAWWVHESITVVGVSIKQTLTLSALLLMVAAVFNRFYTVIDTPFQAFAFFFAEYSAWTPSTESVTVRGRVSRERETNKEKEKEKEKEKGSFLFEEALFVKYREALRWPARPLPATPGSTGTAGDPATVLYVASPLNGENLVTESLSAVQVSRVCKALQGGASNLALFLRQLSSETGGIRDAELIKNYFPNVLTTFADRIEEMSGHIKRSVSYNAEESRASLWLCVHYGLVVHGAQCDRDGVCFAVGALLQSHGPQRVSELFVALRDKVVSSAARDAMLRGDDETTLSAQAVREAVCGATQCFVVVEEDGPDPLVLLRDSLSAQHLSLVERGLLNAQGVLDVFKYYSSGDSSAPSSPHGTPYGRTTSFDELSSLGSASGHSAQSVSLSLSLPQSLSLSHGAQRRPSATSLLSGASDHSAHSALSHNSGFYSGFPTQHSQHSQHTHTQPFAHNNNQFYHTNNTHNAHNTHNNAYSFSSSQHTQHTQHNAHTQHAQSTQHGRGRAGAAQHMGRSLSQPFAPAPGRGNGRSRYATYYQQQSPWNEPF